MWRAGAKAEVTTHCVKCCWAFSSAQLVIFKPILRQFSNWVALELRRTIGLCDKLLRGLDQFELHAKLNWPQSQFPSIDTVPTLCICGTIWENLVQTENGIWENGPDMGTRRHIFPIICTNLARERAQSNVEECTCECVCRCLVQWDNASVKF